MVNRTTAKIVAQVCGGPTNFLTACRQTHRETSEKSKKKRGEEEEKTERADTIISDSYNSKGMGN